MSRDGFTAESNPNEVENFKLRAGASKPPVGIVPMHPLLGVARVLEDSGVKYAPFNYMAQAVTDAVESYDSAELRHRIACSLLGGQVTPETYAALDEDSGLPHIYHRIAGLMIIASLMIRDGVLPADPGIGKRKRAAMMPAEPEDDDEPLCWDCPYQDGECAGCPRKGSQVPTVHATPNGDGTYTVQTAAGVVGNIAVPGSIVTVAERAKTLEPSRAPMTSHHDPLAGKKES